MAAAYAGQSQSRGRPRSGFWAVVLLFAAGLGIAVLSSVLPYSLELLALRRLT